MDLFVITKHWTWGLVVNLGIFKQCIRLYHFKTCQLGDDRQKLHSENGRCGYRYVHATSESVHKDKNHT